MLLEKAKERQGSDHTNIPALIRHWRCEDSQCQNNSKPCYIIKGQHNLIMSNQLAVWDHGINLGTATIGSPPAGMTFQVVSKAHPKPQQLPAPPAASYSPGYPWPPPYMPPPLAYSPFLAAPTVPAPPPSLPATPAAHPVVDALPVAYNDSGTQASSPFNSETDADDILTKYIMWMMQRSPGQRSKLEIALRQLI